MNSYEFPIEGGHVLSFARSLGETNPRYLDDPSSPAFEREPRVAPPTFTQASFRFAPHNPMRIVGREYVGFNEVPDGDSTVVGQSNSNDLHAEQHFEYHRAVIVGETLTVKNRDGATWQKTGRRGGLLTFSESFTDFIDVEGQIVITTRTVGVNTSTNVRRPSHEG